MKVGYSSLQLFCPIPLPKYPKDMATTAHYHDTITDIDVSASAEKAYQ